MTFRYPQLSSGVSSGVIEEVQILYHVCEFRGFPEAGKISDDAWWKIN